MLHIHTETMQPATGWIDTHSGEPMQMGFEPEKLIHALCCAELRPAKNCVVQSYYDSLSIWCAPEQGCKDPQVIAAKKAREFENRSAGQRMRWTRMQVGTHHPNATNGPPSVGTITDLAEKENA